MDLGLKDKVAMVAGASKGLGYAVARALAAEGARVSMASRDADAVKAAAERVRQETGAGTLGVPADVRGAQAIARWHQETVGKLGEVDLLVTNSGGPPAGPLSAFDDAAWQNALDLLLMSVVRMVRTVTPGMVARRQGSLLLLTSSSVKEPIPNLALSNVIRPSGAALAKSLANELAPHGIRVNHLIPGRIATDRLRALDEINSRKAGVALEEQQRRAMANIPLGRYGQPEEFGAAAAFLLSGAAAFITGATLQVDGGQVRYVL